jgi:hypothetical protein
MTVHKGDNLHHKTISSQAPNLVMVEYGEGSETRRLRVLHDGLTNLIRHKV